ncbi:UDP-N-acetylmuramoyl-L-alanyl-D-glutamate--2,6-diaminopimelate ligase [Dongshaea marina]|uniref:UDP-N-acetylmuramoyl-L-alanyl-D-glutamate--2, 6-diaminopimelate ligase n=1 Tax=Dongshaea marina TaxID=2047966 RepID=UPI000D3ED8FB|nr:UDP-N-acetylmuramoyl-L-alanyl-D-glutamate--2,6-diaminopimelate ligase [Dongshaea marina]
MLMLDDLLRPWGVIAPNREVQNITLDSRTLQPGELFLAVRGHEVDGRNYITSAIGKGASAVVVECDSHQQHGSCEVRDGVPCLSFWQLSMHLSAIAARFYGQPAEQMAVVGVTGTNGKSTISHLVANWCQLLGQQSAVMGTLGNGLWQKIRPGTNTTASAVECQQLLAQFVKQRVDVVAMEVSSHGLDQFRVDGIPFRVAVFSNLSRDHLDYHGDLQSYAEAKSRLFSFSSVEHRVINADDLLGRGLIQQYPQSIAYSLKGRPLAHPGDSIWVEAIEFSDSGFCARIGSSFGRGELKVPLLGEFNVENVLAALGSMLALGYEWNALLDVAPRLMAVSGRMELFSSENHPAMVVDYAHTPDALHKALLAVRQHCRGTLWCIFGCGGDRDRGKRSQMMALAEEHADRVVVTDDNPRRESPGQIVSEILAGADKPERVQVIHQRDQAIRWAFEQAAKDDLILVAGKGHEDYQIVGDKVLDFSDRQWVRELQESQS